jgi:hypothetical protein
MKPSLYNRTYPYQDTNSLWKCEKLLDTVTRFISVYFSNNLIAKLNTLIEKHFN